MNTQSDAIPESPIESQGIVPAALSATRPMYWSVRRELWENRSIYIAPLAVAGVLLFGFLIATIGRAVATGDPTRRAGVLAEHNGFAEGLIMATTMIVAIFYSLEALHGERRDRSILFWKSLPVSDLTIVLSKASVPIVILPLLTFAIIVVIQTIMAGLSTVVALGSHLNVPTPWSQMALFQMSVMLLYHLVTVHAIWHAPFYAYLLLVSAWARRAAFLWAFLPLLAIGVVEKIAFNTTHFAHMLGHRLSGPEAFDIKAMESATTHASMMLDPGKFLSAPGLWIGLGFTALFLFAAARLRRYRGPI
jgi:ABC-2 type transport system permease protein